LIIIVFSIILLCMCIYIFLGIRNFNKALKKDRYIPHSEYKNINKKYYILYWITKIINRIVKIKRVRQFVNNFSNLAKYIDEINENFIEKELKDKKDYFDKLFDYSLDLEQRRAIITDDDVNLIVAGAGSGKTTTMAGKIKYLVEKRKIKPENILAISFTNNAVDNLKEKINIENVQCSTFHKLGNEILKNQEENKTIEDNSQTVLRRIIGKYFFENITKDNQKLKEFVEFFSIYLHNLNEKEFESLGETWEYEAERDLTTVKGKIQELERKDELFLLTFCGEKVRSYEELIIANYLFLNGIKYEYEKTYKVNGKSYNYRPDFYLTDYNIYLEHFGINEKGRAKQYNEYEERKYLQDILNKRALHEHNRTTLIETYSYEHRNGTLFENLKKRLEANNVKLEKADYSEIHKVIINKLNTAENQGVIELMTKFIVMFKGNNYRLDKFEEFKKQANKIKNNFTRKREYIFLSIVEEIYKIYQENLKQRSKIDFNDMINLSTDMVKKGEYNKELSYIIVDEYQDISYTRYELLKELQKKTNAKLVLVGDDWQSIYRFTGSSVDLFINPNKYFEFPKIMKINTTHRNSQELIDVTGTFIMKNKNGQIEKTLKSEIKEQYPIEFYYYNRYMKKALDEALKNLIQSGCKEILILGRNKDELVQNYGDYRSKFNKLCQDEQIKIEFKTVHQAKGLEYDGVIVCGLRDALNGFPNKMADDVLLRYVSPSGDCFPYEEERRVFYVALTRTRKKCCLLVPNQKQSQFIDELYKIGQDNIKIIMCEKDETRNNPNCPKCRTGKLLIRENHYDKTKFVGCTNYPKCNYTSSDLATIENIT